MPRPTGGRLPAEVFHPSVFIRDELAARGWTLDMLAARMGADLEVERLALDLYLEVGPDNPGMRLGDGSAEALGRALGVPAAFFLGLEAEWSRARARDDRAARDEPGP